MKRFVTTLTIVCCTAFTVSAGDHFRTIHFTSYWSETQKSGLDMQFGSSPVAGMSTRAEGDIRINTDDSTFSIAANGTTPQVYKINKVDEETDDKQRHYSEVTLQIKDTDGTLYGISVQRHYDLHFVKVFVFPKGSDTYRVYGCDYLKKLR